MNKSNIYLILTLIKAVVGIAAVGFSISYFLLRLNNTKDKKMLKKIGTITIGIWSSLIALTAIEFVIALN